MNNTLYLLLDGGTSLEEDTAAAAYAAALAVDLKRSLVLLQARRAPMALDAETPVPAHETISEAAGEFMATVAAAVQKGFPTLPLTKENLAGLDASTLRKWASEHKVPLVVCSRAVFERLLSLRDRLPFLLLSVPASAIYKPVRSIAVGITPQSAHEDASRLQTLYPLAAALGAGINLVEVESTDARSEAVWPEGIEAPNVVVQRHRVAFHAVEDGLVHFAEKMDNQWLVLLPHHRSWFASIFKPSLTGAIVKAATLPLLILPEEPAYRN